MLLFPFLFIFWHLNSKLCEILVICFPQRKLNFSVIPAPQILLISLKFSVFFTDGRCGELVFVVQAVRGLVGGGLTPEKTCTQENLRANKLRSHPSAQFFWAYGAGGIPPCFPLCPAKLIQEWLSSSDSIYRQNTSAALNNPSVLIGQTMLENDC